MIRSASAAPEEAPPAPKAMDAGCTSTRVRRGVKISPPRTFDPRAYVRELASGNVPVGGFLRVMARAAIEEPQKKLALLPTVYLAGTAKKGDVFETLKLRPGEMVRVKSKEQIARTLDPRGINRGLRFDREMLPFCGQVFKVLRRVERFIDERKGNMVVLKSDAVILEGAFCAGDTTPARWFCPRGIFGFWRECWLERVDEGGRSNIAPIDHH